MKVEHPSYTISRQSNVKEVDSRVTLYEHKSYQRKTDFPRE